MKEGLELIPRPEQPEWVMDGEHFAASLITHIAALPETAYPKRMDLGQFTSVFDDLYNTSQDVYYFSEADRGRFHDEMTSRGEPINEMVINARKKEVEMHERMVPGERSTILYFNCDSGVIKSTPIVFGTRDSVPVDFRDTIREGHIPFSDIHTHPEEYLPSPQDVSIMLRDFEDGFRQVKSGIVLLPNSQVLIVATDKTLALSEAETQQFVDEWSGKINNDPKVKRYESYGMRISRLLGNKGPDMVQAVLQEVVAIEKRKDDGEITEEEMHKLADEVVKKHRDDSETLGYRYGRAGYRAQSVVERRKNELHLEMLRAAGVKVYVSYDRRNFTEFDL